MATQTCEVAIEALVECVYEMLTTADGVSRWWRAPIDRDLVLGSCAELPLGADATVRIRVDRLEPSSLVFWTCVAGIPEWELSTLRFDLEGLGRTTLLHLTHRGWRWRAESGALALSNFSWPRNLTRLRTVAPER